MPRWRDFEDFFPPSRPLPAKGGIRAQPGTAFGVNWWSKRWLEVLDSFNIGSRLQRGRRYARSGQVLGIDVGNGVVTAEVQGSQPAPYEVEIGVKPVPRDAWARVARAASAQAAFASKLLAGEMPQEMERLFEDVGVSLFPKRYRDLQTNCSCPDASNPCKHIAAVYYLLAEEFDRDPFLIFRLRGMEREEFLALLTKGAGGVRREPRREALPADLDAFWKSGPVTGVAAPEPVSKAALPRRLGKFPFWRGSVDLMAFLDEVYEKAARAGYPQKRQMFPPTDRA